MEFRQALPVGSMLTADYRITGVLGQGGFGLTYVADDLRLGTPVAIKEYFPSELALREHGSTVVPRSKREEGVLAWGRAKFLEEARTLARFRHPNIVRVARLFEANNTAYMVLDFEMGPSLGQWRAELGRVPTQAEVDGIAAKLLDAVDAVHEAGILHRDIKPGNVIMRDGIEPVLIDFGAARQAFSAQSRTVHAIVTPGYSPKEQYAVDLDLQGTWSDIYALGATFYFLVTGNSPPDALSRDLGSEAPMARAVTVAVWRPQFLAAIDRAMSVRAEDRPQSVRDWRAMLLAAAPLPGSRRSAGAAAGSSRGDLGASAEARALGAVSVPSLGPARAVSFDEIPSGSSLASAPRGPNWSSVAAGLVALALAGGAGYWFGVVVPERDEIAWQRATIADTSDAYERYIADNPGGRYHAEARQRREARAVADRAGGVSLSSTETRATPPSVVAPSPRTEPAAASPSPASNPPSEGANLPAKSAATPDAPRPPAAAPAPAAAGSTTYASYDCPDGSRSHPITECLGRDAAPGVLPSRPSLSPRALPQPLSDAEVARIAATVVPQRWRLSSGLFQGQAAAGFSDLDSAFAAELQRLSGGRLGADVFEPSSTSSGDVRQDLQRERSLFAWSSPIVDIQRRTELAILAGSVPFGLEPPDHVRWIRSEGAPFLERAYSDLGTPFRVIPCGIAGGVGAWFRREVRSPVDLRGLRVRGPLLVSRALRRLEAEVVSLANVREIGPAFTQGRLDANFGYSNLTGVFLGQPQSVAGFYHYPGVHNPAYLFQLMIGAQTWAEMPEAQRQLIDEACRRHLDQSLSQFAIVQARTIEEIRRQRIVVRPFTGPVREALQKATAEVMAEESERNPRFREVLESYNRFRR